MRRLFWLLPLLALLAACVGPKPRPAVGTDRDGAPSASYDFESIPDAVPRHEPRARYGNPRSYEVFGVRYHVMDSAVGFSERGVASWYGTKFHGKLTSSREPYDMYAMTAAHKHLPLPSYVRVTNLKNGRSVVVRVNDRGPFAKNRIIDLSHAAAAKLDMLREGTAPVEIRVLTPADTAEPVRLAADERPGIEYYVQVGAFSDPANAERRRAQLERAALGAPAQIQSVALPHGTLYRVRLGPVATVADSDRLSDALGRLGYRDAQVVVQSLSP